MERSPSEVADFFLKFLTLKKKIILPKKLIYELLKLFQMYKVLV